MSDREELIAKVGDAMEAADERDILVGWDCFADETIVDWDALAAAAVDVLGLTQQWGHSIQGQTPCQNKSREEAEQALGYWAQQFPDVEHHGQVWSRFVSPWVVA